MLEFIALAVLLTVVYVAIIVAVVEVNDWLGRRRDAKVARIEAELDQAQAQMRATILALAGQLGADAHESRKALIWESFLASGQVLGRE